jgi:glycosyltransferase involved in cell wall biosynthesis
VSREALAPLYAAHDALLFDSPNAEPVALVVMEAFAGGIPVVARHPARPSPLLQPDESCVCFPSSSPHDIAAAIRRIFDDERLRLHVRRHGHNLLGQFSIERMGTAYDVALTELLMRRTTSSMLPQRGPVDFAGRVQHD